jgi:hypothetical protein
MTARNASRSGACPWGGAATPEWGALWQPRQDSARTTHQASPKRQPAGTGRLSTGAFGLIPVGVAVPHPAIARCGGTRSLRGPR